MSECFKGEEIDFKELIDPNVAGFRNTLFKFLEKGINQGPYMPDPSMPLNAPNDPNMAMGMNMFREMGGQQPNYTPYQAPQYWNPQWNPQWPNMNYKPTGGGDNQGTGGGTGDDTGEMGDRVRGKPRKPLPA